MSSDSTSTRRVRRAEASDSSESSLGNFDISNVEFRVVTPPRPMPLVSYPGDEACRYIEKYFGGEFPRKAIEIAAQCGIAESTVEAMLTARVFRDDPSDSQPTVLIVVDEWTTDSRRVWQTVVEKLKKHIDMRVADSPSINQIAISVEMVAEHLIRQKFLSPLDHDELYPHLKSAWPKIKSGVYDILQKFGSTAGHMTAIALFKLGCNEGYNNPKTVYITVNYDSPETGWPPVVQEMQAFVDTFGLNLHVHMEHNLVGHAAFTMVGSNLTNAERDSRLRDFNYNHASPYLTAISSGADIGAGRYILRSDGKLANPPVGTLGCWVEIHLKGKGWKKVALTNYHIVRPAIEGYTMNVKMIQVEAGKPLVDRGDMGDPNQNSELWIADHKGLRPKDKSNHHKMEHPARIKHNFTVETLQRKICSLTQRGKPIPDAFREELNAITSFFDGDKQYFGTVYFASGYLKRTNTNGRLDWALIDPISDDRVGGNTLPSYQDWTENGYDFDEFPDAVGSLKPQTRSIRNMRKGDRVFKKGASTKCTVGQFEEIKPDCTTMEEKYMPGRSMGEQRSTEYMFFPLRNKPLGNRGDSGSVVWDEDGGVTGLLFTGQQPHGCSHGYSLVTPIEDIFEAIKDASRGNILDIRVLEP